MRHVPGPESQIYRQNINCLIGARFVRDPVWSYLLPSSYPQGVTGKTSKECQGAVKDLAWKEGLAWLLLTE